MERIKRSIVCFGLCSTHCDISFGENDKRIDTMGFIWIGAVSAVATGKTITRFIFVRSAMAKKEIKKTCENCNSDFAYILSLCAT